MLSRVTTISIIVLISLIVLISINVLRFIEYKKEYETRNTAISMLSIAIILIYCIQPLRNLIFEI